MQIEKRRDPWPELEILSNLPYNRLTVKDGAQKHYQYEEKVVSEEEETQDKDVHWEPREEDISKGDA